MAESRFGLWNMGEYRLKMGDQWRKELRKVSDAFKLREPADIAPLFFFILLSSPMAVTISDMLVSSTMPPCTISERM
jgi:hypothetical protein